ncbi:MAG: plasmid pRiA4b ORF-3 family protein [Coriobacteriia bacterium]
MDAVTLLITLEDIEPAVWRRVLVPERFTLNGLHRVVQATFGWQDYHLHRFEFESWTAVLPDEVEWDPPGQEWCERMLADGVEPSYVQRVMAPPADERRIRLTHLVGWEINKFEYRYDFGDDWLHLIQIEGVEEIDARRLPALLGGACSAPPEDCGGLPGYEQIQRTYAGEPVDDWGQELADWVRGNMGPMWTPESFDAALIEDRLSRTWRGPRK